MEWISVKDKLPEENVYVLGLNKEGSFYIVCYCTTNKDRYNYDGWEYNLCPCCDFVDGKFTHWMPLPEPPK